MVRDRRNIGLDPDADVAKALATRATWIGITLNWPVDGGNRVPVELSGLPVFDPARNFYGYRGFGVCRDIDGLVRLAAERDHPASEGAAPPPAWSADIVQAGPAPDAPPDDIGAEDSPDPTSCVIFLRDIARRNGDRDFTPNRSGHARGPPKEIQEDTHTEMPADTLAHIPAETPVETPKNVLPFRPLGEAKPPSLTPVENSAFNELAAAIISSARHRRQHRCTRCHRLRRHRRRKARPGSDVRKPRRTTHEAPAAETPEWLAPSEPPARGETRRDKPLLDLLPVGILIYRLDRLLYANPAFLTQMGYPSLHSLEDAGGLDALYVEPGVSNASSTSDTGTPVTISASQTSDAHSPPSAAAARLYTISWDGDSALALIFSGTRHEGEAVAAAIAQANPVGLRPVEVESC